MSFSNAASYFRQALEAVGGEGAKTTDPEKYNLYTGLRRLAQALDDLEKKVRRL